MKAFALVAADMPELRTCYIDFPWPHLYQHQMSVASIAVEKQSDGAHVVSFAKVADPANRKLSALDRYLRSFARSTTRNSGVAALAVWMRYLWRPLRLFVWWCGLNLNGHFRAQQIGTFAISVYSALGAESLHPLTPLSFLLNYGLIDDQGNVDVRIVYDHRVMDGAMVARALAAMEVTLNGPIVAELQSLRADTIQ